MHRLLFSVPAIFAVMLLTATLVAQPPGQSGPPQGGPPQGGPPQGGPPQGGPPQGGPPQGGPGGQGFGGPQGGPPQGGFRQGGQGRGGQGRGGQGRGGQGRGGQGRGGFRGPDMSMFPLMAALDADKDGVISKNEIKNAAKALKKLDKNNDGKLSAEEIQPQRQARGGRGFGPPGGPGGPGAGRGGPGAGRGGLGGGGPPGGGDQRGPAASVDDIIAQIFLLDKNKDKKISKDEMPERMQAILREGDTNKDDSLDEKEVRTMAEKQPARVGGGAGRGGRGNRGGQGGANRPKRPESDDE